MSTPTTVPTPETITTSNSQTEIAAALAAAKSAPPTPETPPSPAPTSVAEAQALPVKADWGEYTKNTDGTYDVKLATGEVFKGTFEDVLANMGKSQVETKKYAQTLKAQVPAPVVPVVTDADAAKQELLNQYFATIGNDPVQATMLAVAKGFGYESVEQMQQEMGEIRGVSQAQKGQQVATAFISSCPDFPNSEDAINKVEARMKTHNLPFTAANLKLVHAACIAEGDYKPLSKEEQQAALAAGLGLTPQTIAATPKIAPMVTGSAPTNPATTNVSTANTQDEIMAAIAAERKKLGL